MFEELHQLSWDKKAFMYGRVCNKRARYNLCFDDKSQEPDYEQHQGRIYAFDKVPSLKTIREAIPAKIDARFPNLVAEGNYYYKSDTGIGFHGDAERKVVIAARVASQEPAPTTCQPLVYQWYYRNAAVGSRIVIDLNPGDVYIMSSKAVGTDWKSSSKYTLRHATGSKKYIQKDALGKPAQPARKMAKMQ
eukprot:m.37492 g.37492  ORF g.37492 m.37492 type:complete len:191 (-) comp12511_c0_seq1:54-626(-)